jgi:hypothetical protein
MHIVSLLLLCLYVLLTPCLLAFLVCVLPSVYAHCLMSLSLSSGMLVICLFAQPTPLLDQYSCIALRWGHDILRIPVLSVLTVRPGTV